MHRPQSWSAPALVALCLGLGCSTDSGTARGNDGTRAGDATRVAACEAATKTAQLYPASAMLRTDTRARMLAVTWARRDGGVGHHPPARPWRRNTDLSFKETNGALQVSYTVVSESKDGEPVSSAWTKACEVCGDLLICGDEVSTLRVRDGDLQGDTMAWLDTTEMVPVEDGGMYMVRYGHEIVLRFETDPLTVDAGTVAVQMRKLDPSAKASTASVEFTSTKRNASDTRKQVQLELPNGVGRLRFDQRLDDKTTFLRSEGASKMLAKVLFDGLKLALSSHLGKQPSWD